jgi:hypothetical protein
VDCPCETCWEACPCKILTAITKVSHRSPLPEALQSLKRAALVVDRLFLWVPSSVIEAFAEPKCSTPVAVDHQTDGEAIWPQFNYFKSSQGPSFVDSQTCRIEASSRD